MGNFIAFTECVQNCLMESITEIAIEANQLFNFMEKLLNTDGTMGKFKIQLCDLSFNRIHVNFIQNIQTTNSFVFCENIKPGL